MVTIKSKQCVNSKWTAAFLAEGNQEHCECGMCKIRVIYKDYEYIVTEQELEKLGDDNRQVDVEVTCGHCGWEGKETELLGEYYNQYNGCEEWLCPKCKNAVD